MARLQAMVNAAKEAEHEINQIVSISMGNQYRRNPVGGTQGNNAATAGRSFSTMTQDAPSAEFASAATKIVHRSLGASAGPTSNLAVPGSVEHFALSCLSHAECALRESSNTNAPIECWGCHGIHPGSDHLYKDCPHKAQPQVQRRFKEKLEEFLQRR